MLLWLIFTTFYNKNNNEYITEYCVIIATEHEIIYFCILSKLTIKKCIIMQGSSL